jgi:hypothetical protein
MEIIASVEQKEKNEQKSEQNQRGFWDIKWNIVYIMVVPKGEERGKGKGNSLKNNG